MEDDANVYLDHDCLTCGDAEGDLEIEPLPTAPRQPDALYDPPGMPLHWLARVEGKLWIVPALHHGWDSRSKYHGPPPEMAGYQAVSMKYALGCDIPWSAP